MLDEKVLALRVALVSLALILPEFLCGRASSATFRFQNLFFITPQFVAIALVVMNARIVWRNFRPKTQFYILHAQILSLFLLCVAMEQSGFRMVMRTCCAFTSMW
ncbi:unnamed protein product [Aphanomyces euteiches]